MKKSISQKGFTLLLAAIISSIVLSMGVAIFSIAQKQVVLSSLGRDSQFAFYAADMSAECALFQDVRNGLFSTSSPPTNVNCDGQTVAVTTTSGATTTFAYQFAPNGLCTNVVVSKWFDSGASSVRTIVHADGYNTTCADINGSNRALQRSVELSY